MVKSVATLFWHIQDKRDVLTFHDHCQAEFTCLCGLQEAEWHLTNDIKDIYPDFVKMAESFSVPSKRVLKPEDLRPAIRFAHNPES